MYNRTHPNGLKKMALKQDGSLTKAEESGGARVKTLSKSGSSLDQAQTEELTEATAELSITGSSLVPSAYDSLSVEHKKVVDHLKSVQEEYKKHHAEYQKELALLKVKYEKLYRPCYKQRTEILNKSTADGGEKKGTPALPGFWLKSFQKCSALKTAIEESDTPILEYLENVTWDWIDEDQQQLGFELVFTFSPNPYFTPNVLHKKYNMTTSDDEPEAVLNNTESTKIEWKEDKNPTIMKVQRKQRNKRTKQTRTVTEDVERESFFNFFASHELPSEEELNAMPEREVSDLEYFIETDYEMGLSIRDKIIPDAVSWFLGEIHDNNDDYDEDFEDDDDDDDEGSHSDDSDD